MEKVFREVAVCAVAILAAGCGSMRERTHVSSDRDPAEARREEKTKGIACGVDMAVRLAAWIAGGRPCPEPE